MAGDRDGVDSRGLPLSGSAAWWLTAWLTGHGSADEALHHLGDGGRVSVSLPDGPGDGLDLLTLLRRTDVPAAGLALAQEGDLVGLGGPAAFNHAALEAGEAVVAQMWGLVPTIEPHGVHWDVHRADRRPVPDLYEASRMLRLAVIETAEALAALDVARWNPDVADALMDLHHRPALSAPPGTPPAAVDLAARGAQAREIVALAEHDDGAAVSSYEINRRRDLLRPLASAGRRALVAACSPEVWPPPDHGIEPG